MRSEEKLVPKSRSYIMGNVSVSKRKREKVCYNESTCNVRTEQLAMVFPRLLLFFSVYFFTLIM